MRKALLITVACTVTFALAAGGQDWPQWRGPEATGTSPDANPPVHWSEDTNVRWKVEIPGKGHATPIVWKDLVYLLSAIPVHPEAEPETPPPRKTSKPSRVPSSRRTRTPLRPMSAVKCWAQLEGQPLM